MKQHIRRGVLLAGLRLSEVDVRGPGHVRLTLPNGRRVTASSSPRDPHTAALNIARDIRVAMGVQK
jgi:hypothetical protein